MNCVAIDFETANAKRSSVCAMGIAVIHGHRIAKRASWLIRPPELYFDPYNVFIHGITEADVANEPEFDVLWSEFEQYFDGRRVVAHNASFDISVLRHVLDEYAIPYPRLDYFCTRVIAKRTWPGLSSYGLATVAEHLKVQFVHHDAEEDACACARIAMCACKELKVESLADIPERVGIAVGHLFSGGFKPCGVRRERPEQIQPTTDQFNPDHPLYGKAVVLTGTLQSMVRREAMQKVVDCGGVCMTAVTKRTNFLVLGDQDFRKLKDGKKSRKLHKAESLIANGADLEIIPEVDFLQMLGR